MRIEDQGVVEEEWLLKLVVHVSPLLFPGAFRDPLASF
jgi:hypothetical protein